VDQVINSKDVDIVTLYNFCKGRMAFSQPMMQKSHAKITIFWAPVNCTLQGFPPIATNPLVNTTISVAIGGYYCTETVIWLQFVCLLQHKI
jgi:hypothetical protein